LAAGVVLMMMKMKVSVALVVVVKGSWLYGCALSRSLFQPYD
jgi:hypothetical protein